MRAVIFEIGVGVAKAWRQTLIGRENARWEGLPKTPVELLEKSLATIEVRCQRFEDVAAASEKHFQTKKSILPLVFLTTRDLQLNCLRDR